MLSHRLRSPDRHIPVVIYLPAMSASVCMQVWLIHLPVMSLSVCLQVWLIHLPLISLSVCLQVWLIHLPLMSLSICLISDSFTCLWYLCLYVWRSDSFTCLWCLSVCLQVWLIHLPLMSVCMSGGLTHSPASDVSVCLWSDSVCLIYLFAPECLPTTAIMSILTRFADFMHGRLSMLSLSASDGSL